MKLHRLSTFAWYLSSFLLIATLKAQELKTSSTKPSRYTSQNAHSHNDYQQQHPFVTAYNAKFGSMEADIFLVNDSLYVGHTILDVAKHKTLSSLYLDPLLKQINAHQGFPYASKTLSLQLLIDLKTEGATTLPALVKLLEKYPAIIQSKAVSIVITGNRPPVKDWFGYPAFILFDGNIGETYPANVLPKIAMMSGDFANLTKWDGKMIVPPQDSLKIITTIAATHAQGKKIRFWDAPDVSNAWLQFMSWGVDWINTDHIDELATYLFFRAAIKQ